MSVLVVDASVVVKWFVPEIHSEAARRLLLLPHEYVAPALLVAETANTIWKKIRREELTAEGGQQLVADIEQIAVETVPCRALAEDAHALANATGRTVYDSMYDALAVRLNTRSITADNRLEAALKRIPAVASLRRASRSAGRRRDLAVFARQWPARVRRIHRRGDTA